MKLASIIGFHCCSVGAFGFELVGSGSGAGPRQIGYAKISTAPPITSASWHRRRNWHNNELITRLRSAHSSHTHTQILQRLDLARLAGSAHAGSESTKSCALFAASRSDPLPPVSLSARTHAACAARCSADCVCVCLAADPREYRFGVRERRTIGSNARVAISATRSILCARTRVLLSGIAAICGGRTQSKPVCMCARRPCAQAERNPSPHSVSAQSAPPRVHPDDFLIILRACARARTQITGVNMARAAHTPYVRV